MKLKPEIVFTKIIIILYLLFHSNRYLKNNHCFTLFLIKIFPLFFQIIFTQRSMIISFLFLYEYEKLHIFILLYIGYIIISNVIISGDFYLFLHCKYITSNKIIIMLKLIIKFSSSCLLIE
jgi:hypothetical protein